MIEESTYPQSPFIKYFDTKRTFYYEIIKEGTYPLTKQLCYTKKSNHPIPHDYVIKTTYGKAKHVVECSIEYVESKPLFKVRFGINLISEVQSSESSTDAACKYYQTRSLDKIRPFSEISNTTKRRKILGLSHRILNVVESEKENTFHKNDELKLKQVTFQTCNDMYNVNFGQEAYRSLARIEQNIPREGDVYNVRQQINNEMKKMIPLTLVDLLQPTVFEPISEEPDVTDNTIIMNILESVGKGGRSTLHIRISGDGRNVGRKVKHVMLTMALLNDIDGLQKPDNHYTLVLYPGAETYESLKNALAPLISDLAILKEKGFNQINGHYWPVELYFSSDWNKDEIDITSKKINKSIDNIKLNYNQINGHTKEPLFHMIPLHNWVVDKLHIFLRITDRLWGLMLSDLRRDTVNEEVWKEKILLEMQRLKISFQFWYERNSNNLSHTSLMGPDKLKVLRELDLTAIFQSRTRAMQIHALWDQFHDLYYLIQDRQTTGEIFQREVQAWLDSFLVPSIGHPNKSGFVRGMYRIQDITPYMHVLVNHVSEFIDVHRAFGLTAFSCSAVEKKNHMQTCLYFQNTLKDGGCENSRKSAILEILEHENRQLYFSLNDTPNFFNKPKSYSIY
ncbi:hypothetical protein GLOIN_2v1775051 [Rhizophagus clarus]|uniref:Uncharacterized protein n=1 Tax=Rhizophagus clarus TaxID=94130 RepID=A0A8H3LQZ4_9GLOM|nr:hypothetical protein GLOIN_2v1775051 [Rhizophagus clarus]